MEHSACAIRFLLLCSQPSPGADRRATIRRLMRGPLPWEAIVACAHWHDTCALMHAVLKDLPEQGAIPLHIRRFLEGTYRDHVIRNLRIHGELHRALEAFRDGGIDTLPLKGAALAEPLYRDVAARPMGDIDLLVRPSDVPRAEEALLDLGYAVHEGESADFQRRHHYHLTYFHNAREVPIELHWNIGRPKGKSRINLHDEDLIERWFTRAESAALAGSAARVPAPHDMLLHLCVHFLKHRFPGNGGLVSAGALLQLADIALLLSGPQEGLSWDLLYEETERRDLTGAVGAVLGMALTLTDEEARPALDQRFSELSKDDRAAEATMWRRMFSHEDADLRFSATDLRFLHPRPGRRLRHLARTLVPPKTRLARQHGIEPNSGHLYLHYLRRPAELHRIWRRLHSDPLRAREEARLRDWLRLDG